MPARSTEAWSPRAKAIRETGNLLLQAKAELAHGKFLSMIEIKLPFGPRQAEFLMEIARHPIVGNANHDSHLPDTIYTRYLLSKVPSEQLQQMLRDGTINPELRRKQVEQLLREIETNGVYWWRQVSQAFEVMIEFMDRRAKPKDIAQFVEASYQMRSRGRKVWKELARLGEFMHTLDAACQAKLADPEVREELAAVSRFREAVKESRDRAEGRYKPWFKRPRQFRAKRWRAGDRSDPPVPVIEE